MILHIYLINKDENGNVSSSGTAVLLKFDTLQSLEKSYQVSLLQCLPTASVLSNTIYKSSIYCQSQECH